MGLRAAGEIAQELSDLADGHYSTNIETLEHGNRLQSVLDPGEKLKAAGYATQFEGKRSGCGIVMAKKRFFLLPERRYFSVTQAAWGAVCGKGDVVTVPYSSVRRVEAFSLQRRPGFIDNLIDGRYTDDNLWIIFTNGETVKLESILGTGQDIVLMNRFRKYI